MDRNHEGYADHTACEAVRRADRSRRRKRAVNRPIHLTYLLREAGGFVEAVNTLYR